MVISQINITRNDDDDPVLWNMEVFSVKGDKITLYLNKVELEELHEGLDGLLDGHSEFTLEVAQ